MPGPPQPGIEADPTEAVAGRGELGLERLAPHLPVVDDRQVQFILQRDDLPHSAVLGRLELRRRNLTPRAGRPRVTQERRGAAAPPPFPTRGRPPPPHTPPVPPPRRPQP